MLKFCIAVTCIVHIIACLWYFCARLDDFNPDTWVTSGGLLDSEEGTLYLAALYWAFTTATTVGYGDFSATTELEMVFAILWMIVGVGFYSYAVGSLSSIME